MKKTLYTLIVLIGLFFVNQHLFAQIRINQAGIGLSNWSRTYAGPDERILFVDGMASENFSSRALLPNIFVEVGLFRDFGVELRAASWKNTFDGRSTLGDNIVVEEKIVQRVTPISLGFTYTLKVPDLEDFFLNLGFGYNRYFLQNEVSREVRGSDGTVTPRVYSGKDNGLYAKLGVEYRITEELGVALQGRYHFGHYTQNARASAESPLVSRDISLRGFEIGITVAYRLEDLFVKKTGISNVAKGK